MNNRRAVFAAVLAGSFAAVHVAAGQTLDTKSVDSASRWSLIVPSGSIIPVGAQRHAIKRGNVTAIQLAYALRPTFAITSTFGWARSRDIATAGDPKLDVFTYDVGAEARASQGAEGIGSVITPFAGAGIGGRSYNYRKLDVDATHNLGGYVSAGSDIRVKRVGVRIEARDYVTGFKPLDGSGDARVGNDVVVMIGLRLISR